MYTASLVTASTTTRTRISFAWSSEPYKSLAKLFTKQLLSGDVRTGNGSGSGQSKELHSESDM